MLIGSYIPSLVVISILVAILAAYTALDLVGRIVSARGRAVHLWTAGGAIAMGVGTWSTHFIGMLAFVLPIDLGYDVPLVLLSLLIAIGFSGFALWLATQPRLPALQLSLGAVLLGLGISAMHYTGMTAMRMQPGIQYTPWLFVLSVVIAIAASAAALRIAFHLRQQRPRVYLLRASAALLLGLAVIGMHYTGMAAANFADGSFRGALPPGLCSNG
ncbi:histidine kinase, partial [Pseudomonas syringae]|uniref:MHYT domain-containing protein n=1 Tax=Pseudomonas syringae TaxID=317 RepID=UPI0010251E95